MSCFRQAAHAASAGVQQFQRLADQRHSGFGTGEQRVHRLVPALPHRLFGDQVALQLAVGQADDEAVRAPRPSPQRELHEDLARPADERPRPDPHEHDLGGHHRGDRVVATARRRPLGPRPASPRRRTSRTPPCGPRGDPPADWRSDSSRCGRLRPVAFWASPTGGNVRAAGRPSPGDSRA